MIKPALLLAAAASALIATPALARPMTAADMHMMHRLGSPDVSPDGRYAVFTVSDTDMAANKRRNDIYVLDLTAANGAPQKLMATPDQSESSPAFSADGKQIYFISGKSGSDQVWRIQRGQRAVQVTHAAVDIAGFTVSPDGRKLLLYADVANGCDLKGCAKQEPASGGSGRVYENSGFIRHWDTWATPGTFSRLYSYDLASRASIPLTTGLVGHAPGKPFGGNEELAWAPDSQSVFFVLRKADANEPRSTNLDVYQVKLDGSAPVNLTAANLATDTMPAVSPDGRTLAYVAMKRPGYESDRQVLQLRDLATGQTRPLTEAWDRSVASIAWAPDGKSLLVTAGDTLEEPIFRIDARTGQVTRLTTDGTFGNVHVLPGGAVLATMNSIEGPDELYLIEGDQVLGLTNLNGALLSQLDPVSFEKFSFAGANNDKVWGWELKPKGATGKLPIAFLVHGGPQGSFSNSWSYRWNPRLFSAPGYGVVSVDFHGSTGYGQAFTDAINKDWGGKPLEDQLKGLAYATAHDPQLDADNACALGGSYGGYMMNWIEGKWPDRFKCIVQHDGVFDARAMAYETEELWFDQWEHGGHAYFEAPQEYERWNPVNYVNNWKTPQLVITSENDFRIPYTQGIAAYTALQLKRVPSRLVVFPDESHWVLKPKNSIQWYDEVFGWMDRWMGPGAAERR
jgi:dipeptidyl aminopeptidase/acylaminoacyl peptidase